MNENGAASSTAGDKDRIDNLQLGIRLITLLKGITALALSNFALALADCQELV